MLRIEETLCASIKEIITHKRYLYPHTTISMSGHCTPGEAEDKIMNSIHQRHTKLKLEKKYLIIGSDSDLFIHTIAAEPQEVCIINGVKEEDLFCKSLFMKSLANCLPGLDLKILKEDLLFLSQWCGNDYLPSVAYGHIKVTWPIYLEFRQNMIKEKRAEIESFVNSDKRVLNAQLLKSFAEYVVHKGKYSTHQKGYESIMGTLKKVDTKCYLKKILSMHLNILCKKYSGITNFQEGFNQNSSDQEGLAGPSIFDLCELKQDDIVLDAPRIIPPKNMQIQHPAISTIMVIF